MPDGDLDDAIRAVAHIHGATARVFGDGAWMLDDHPVSVLNLGYAWRVTVDAAAWTLTPSEYRRWNAEMSSRIAPPCDTV